MKVEWLLLSLWFLSVFQGLLKMKLLPRLRYILEVLRPSPRVVQHVLQILTRIARHSSSSATQVATTTVAESVCHACSIIDYYYLYSSSCQIQSNCISLSGAWLSSLDGDGVVRVPSLFLDGAMFSPPSVCLWSPTGQRHEAAESIGYLWQTCLCQTGKCWCNSV